MLTPTILLNLLVMSMATIKTYVFSLGVVIVGGLLYCFGVRRQVEENLDGDENGVEVTRGSYM